jgi:flagellar biosynthesis component FlhA
LDGDQYILLCLEALIIQNLGRLFGIDEAEELMNGWSSQGNLGELLEETLPGKSGRVYFTRLLRNLVQARAPITRARTILEGFRHFVSGEASFEESETRIRSSLRALLPGNQPGAVRKELPAETEASMLQYLYNLNGRSILAAPMSVAMEWIKTLGELGNKADLRTCVVVEDARLRPALEYLFQVEAPGWTVMTRAELIPHSD